MFNSDTKTVWYGLLKTKKTAIPVVFNPKLPEPPRNQLYLYNAAKDAIVVYVRDIVEPLLADYGTEEEVAQAEKELKSKWKEACKEFLKVRGDVVIPASGPKAEPKKKSLLDDDPDIQIDEAALGEEEWLDDDV